MLIKVTLFDEMGVLPRVRHAELVTVSPLHYQDVTDSSVHPNLSYPNFTELLTCLTPVTGFYSNHIFVL